VMKIPKSWAFSSDTIAESFDQHVNEQLPWYSLATRVVHHVARHYMAHGSKVIEIGASTGNIQQALQEDLRDRECSYYAVDDCEEMKAFYSGDGELHIKSALDVDYNGCQICIAFLVFMFIKQDKRGALIKRILAELNHGGVMIVVDKFHASCASPYAATVSRRLSMGLKRENGIQPCDIIDKELSLSGVQMPMNESFFELHEFAYRVFQVGEFQGWVIEKPCDI